MRVFIIAFGLVGLYTLAAPSGQSDTRRAVYGRSYGDNRQRL